MYIIEKERERELGFSQGTTTRGATKTKMCARYTDCERVVKGKEGFVLGQGKKKKFSWTPASCSFLSLSRRYRSLCLLPFLFFPLSSSSLLSSLLPFTPYDTRMPTLPYAYTYPSLSLSLSLSPRFLSFFPSFASLPVASLSSLSLSRSVGVPRTLEYIRRNASKNPSN